MIDLAERIHVSAYEIPDRLKKQVHLREGHCVFPLPPTSQRLRHRPQPTLRPRWDYVHSQPRTANLATLCRRHHRLKTHGGWTYRRIDATTYERTSPHGLVIRRDHHGTHTP